MGKLQGMGQKRRYNHEQIITYVIQGYSIEDIMRMLDCSEQFVSQVIRGKASAIYNSLPVEKVAAIKSFVINKDNKNKSIPELGKQLNLCACAIRQVISFSNSGAVYVGRDNHEMRCSCGQRYVGKPGSMCPKCLTNYNKAH